MFHAALTIFHPYKPQQFDYMRELARVRLRNFLAQKAVTEMSILTSVNPKTDNFLQLFLKESFAGHLNKVDVFIMRGKNHPGCGYLQQIIEPETEWVYFDEDAHCLPTHRLD